MTAARPTPASRVPPMLDRFGATSHWAYLDGPVHYVDFGGPASGTPIVCVHGLGGSHTNWLSVGKGLARHGRVLALDLGGFGRTPPQRGATVDANRELLGDFLTEVVGEPAVLVGNSMGGALSILQAAADPDSVAGLVLVGPALPRELLAPIDRVVAGQFALHALPAVGPAWLRRRAARLGAEGITRETLALCCVDVDRVPEEAVAATVELRRERESMPWAEQSFLDASRSLMAKLLRRRAFDEQVAAITAPALIIHGVQDRLVALANVKRLAELRPDWQLELLDDIGHVPQLEVPDRFVDLVGAWLSRLPAGAGTAG